MAYAYMVKYIGNPPTCDVAESREHKRVFVADPEDICRTLRKRGDELISIELIGEAEVDVIDD